MGWNWFQLPKDAESLSLWECLHDGELCSTSSDLRAQTLTLKFQVEHLVKEVEFIFEMAGVATVLATKHPVPFEFEEPADATPEVRAGLIREYQKKWRTESVDWQEFESVLQTDPLQITGADFLRNKECVTLIVGGFLDGERYDDLYCSIAITARDVQVSRNDGEACDLQAFCELGQNYWNKRSAR
jgi:hypothetical protein